MQPGLYVALSGQVALERRLTTIAANIANLATPGYRAEEVEFKTVLSQAGTRSVAYVSHGTSYLSRRIGTPIKTDNPLDVAIHGTGWLALQSPAGTVYTRDGRMRMEPNGALVSVSGYPILDAGNAPIQLDPEGGPIQIAQDGMITQNGQQIGAIGLFSFDEGTKLKRYDNSAVISDTPPTPVLDFARNGFAQGYIEGANVNPVLEITKLITLSRAFENAAAAVGGADESLKDAIRTLGSSV
jgi:flagellar basal-body rod protein FlgF